MAAKPSDPIERERNALKLSLRILDGETLTPGELDEVRWLKLNHFREMATALPKGEYLSLANRDQNSVDRQARAFKMTSMLSKTVNLFVAIDQLHSFIANNNKKIKQIDEVQAAKKTAETRKIEIQIENMEISLLERKGELISRSLVRESLTWLASQFSAMAEDVGRRHGVGPQNAINDFLKIMGREVESGKLKV